MRTWPESLKETCTYLVKDTPIVRVDVVCIEEDALLYCNHTCLAASTAQSVNHVRRLKLVTGVEISTRPVRRSGKEGKAVNSSRRSTAAEANSNVFCLPTNMTLAMVVHNACLGRGGLDHAELLCCHQKPGW